MNNFAFLPSVQSKRAEVLGKWQARARTNDQRVYDLGWEAGAALVVQMSREFVIHRLRLFRLLRLFHL